MKKNINYFVLVSLVAIIILVFGLSVITAPVKAETMSISQLVELLITIGAISPDKAVAARAVVTSLGSVVTSAVASSSAYVQALSPNGGESWNIDLDTAYTITWGSVGLTKARIALVPSAKKIPACELSPNQVSSPDGNHELDIILKTAKCYNLLTGTSTPLSDGTYKLRVYYTDASGYTIEDTSNTVFKILPKLTPSIKVLYPNGGEILTRHHDYNAKYKLTNVSKVDGNLIYMDLLDNNGHTVLSSYKTKRSDGVYNLELPSSLSAGAYKMKLMAIESTDDVTIEDTSDNFFWISTGL